MRQRVLIVDDEALARRAVARQVAVVLPDADVHEARDGFEALALVAERAPTLIFLDVEMPELSGLDVLRQLPAPRPLVVFVTAYEQFAVRAFEENACDYLVKPFTAARFAQAVARATSELDTDRRLRALERSLAGAGEHLTRLAVRTGARVDVVAIADVSCFVSKGHYTYVHAGAREHLTELSLVHLEERVDPSRFVRVHRNALVNVNRVVRVVDGAVELDVGLRVPVSRRCRAALLARLAS